MLFRSVWIKARGAQLRLDLFSDEKYSNLVGAERPEILNSFRAHGLRCTPQRYAILAQLMQYPAHPTVEEIYKAINREDPRASRATVYNGLQALARTGLIREVNLAGNAIRYEYHTERHHHFVCQHCGRIEDLEWFDVPDIARRAKAAPRVVRTWELVLQGFCESCRSKQKEKLRWDK